MKKVVTVLLAISVAAGLAGCADMSTVMKSDATFTEKVKQLGGIVGNYFDKQSGTRAEAVKKYNYAERGDLLEIDSASLTPEAASPGSMVESLVQYTVLAPVATQQVKVTETRTLVLAKDSIQLSSREVLRDQGTQSTTLKFTLPKDIARGSYVLVTTVSDGKNTKTARNSLKVT